MRRHEIGFVFQAYNVLPVLMAEENITLPQRIGNQQVDRGWLETLIDASTLASAGAQLGSGCLSLAVQDAFSRRIVGRLVDERSADENRPWR